jgi:hypothetical protein
MKSEYKYIRFIETSVPEGWTTKGWELTNRKSGDTLGWVHYEAHWRQYVFEPSGNTIYSTGCLTDIAEFLSEANTQQKKKTAPPPPSPELQAIGQTEKWSTLR